MTLLICRTCPRYDRRSTGQFGRDLAAAITATGTDVPIRNVQCLGGCPTTASPRSTDPACPASGSSA